MRTHPIRIIVTAVLILGALWVLKPTWEHSRLTPEAIQADPARATSLREKAITLGLDLQGGIHLVLGVKAEKLRHSVIQNAIKSVPVIFNENQVAATAVTATPDGRGIVVSVATEAASRKESMDAIVRQLEFFEEPSVADEPGQPGRSLLTFALKRERFEVELQSATRRALEIIRNRIDAFGVAEPTIYEAGIDKIVVELPGATDPRRARDLIGRTAQLEFHKVREPAELQAALNAMDPLSGGALLKLVAQKGQGGAGVSFVLADVAKREEMIRILADPAVASGAPAGTRVHLGIPEKSGNRDVIPLYLLKADHEMTGANLQTARVFWNERNQAAVSFEFNTAGAEQFGKLTAELMQGQKPLAIVLDGFVQSAPHVKSMITRRGEITGSFTPEEAQDLAVVLRSGALPAPVEILEDRTIGPSLGRDSIESGLKASVIGVIIVMIFMIIRYKVGGLVASAALGINILFVLAVLAGALLDIKATLTLPGLAGIVLAMGMAVDANILIFERTREELRAGKGPFHALNAGYEKAFWTIFDSNITTLITALILIEFGTGPIRGFAVTLSIGIISSMFTAIWISRAIFDRIVLMGRDPRLSI